MKPTIALVQGDATGIGPELMAKLLADSQVRDSANIIVLSDVNVFNNGCAVAQESHDVELVESVAAANFDSTKVQLINMPLPDSATVVPGIVNKDAGAAVLDCYGTALDLCAAGTTDGLCFMPFNKDAMHQGGLDTEDETQWAAKRLKLQGRASEFNVIDGMWNARVTSHIPLKDVANHITGDEIVAAVQLADTTLREAGFDEPRIAVAALNPHAGDGGNIGREEIEVITPAVEEAKSLGLNVAGPFPSDTLYIRVRDGHYDCAVSMYHDQGQIAIKLLGFQMGVSVHAGLPFPMATPAHGTAFDIVGQNKANVEPARRAFQIVTKMACAQGAHRTMTA